jgi:hypothetical protein
MKFRKTITSIGTLKNLDFYDFSFTKEQIEEAKKRTYENPLLIWDRGSVYALYYEKGTLRVNYFISYYGFEEGLGEHKPKEFDNLVLCSCGKRFPQGKKKLGMQNFNKHLQEIKKLKDEENNKCQKD